MSDKEHPITTLSSRIDWQSPYYRIRRDDIRLPDGSDGVYHVIESSPSVFVVPVTHDKQIVLIRNYRYTLQQWVWEVPAGGIKAEQSPDEAAHEELHEEIGGITDKLHFLMKASTMNGIGNNYAHFFIALDVTLHEPKHEPAEIMTRHSMSLEDVMRLIDAGEMNDVSSMTALFLAREFLAKIRPINLP